jgi:hypothetical protein
MEHDGRPLGLLITQRSRVQIPPPPPSSPGTSPLTSFGEWGASPVLAAEVVDGQFRVSAEAAKVAWLSAEEVAERMDEAYAMRLLDALRPGPPAVRAHDGLVVLAT